MLTKVFHMKNHILLFFIIIIQHRIVTFGMFNATVISTFTNTKYRT